MRNAGAGGHPLDVSVSKSPRGAQAVRVVDEASDGLMFIPMANRSGQTIAEAIIYFTGSREAITKIGKFYNDGAMSFRKALGEAVDPTP